jgi:putative NADPH-quinone reductase
MGGSLVWIHPVWWGGLPAITKGFIDRLFLPGMAYKYRDNSILWDKLLKGKTARIITTLDQPGWYYRLCMEDQVSISFGNLLCNFVVSLR